MRQQALGYGLVLVLAVAPVWAQNKRLTACKKTAAAAVKPMPELNYPCGEQEWDQKQLKSPARLAALNAMASELATLTDSAWWQTSVDELNACDFKGGIRPSGGSMMTDVRFSPLITATLIPRSVQN